MTRFVMPGPADPDPEPDPAVAELAEQKFQLDARIVQLKTRSEGIRDRLLAIAETHGARDANGHLRVYLSDPVVVGSKTFTGFYRQRSTSFTFNSEAARELAISKGVLDRVLRTEEHIDQDAFYGLQQEGLITRDELDSLITTEHSYALKGIHDATHAGRPTRTQGRARSANLRRRSR